MNWCCSVVNLISGHILGGGTAPSLTKLEQPQRCELSPVVDKISRREQGADVLRLVVCINNKDMANKRKSLDLKTKLEILMEVQRGVITKTKIAEKFGISKSTLSTIIAQGDKIIAALVSSSASTSSKKLRGAAHDIVDSELLQ